MRLMLLMMLAGATLPAQDAETALERYLEESLHRRERFRPSAGSLYTANGLLADAARDPRASRVGDLITVIISEQASATASGSLRQSRSSDADSGVSRLLGLMAASRPLPNLFGSSTEYDLNGAGATGRQTNVAAVVTAHVTAVTSNGNLVIEGVKEVAVNAERQTVWLRGVVRPADLAQDNSVLSSRVGLLELELDGKGVVHAAIRKPNPVYRFFRRLLPF